jgi:hypothetical protein
MSHVILVTLVAAPLMADPHWPLDRRTGLRDTLFVRHEWQASRRYRAGRERKTSVRSWYSDLELLGKLLVPWTGAILLAIIAITAWVATLPDASGIWLGFGFGLVVIGLFVWAVGLGVLRFITDLVESRRHRPEPRPRLF